MELGSQGMRFVTLVFALSPILRVKGLALCATFLGWASHEKGGGMSEMMTGINLIIAAAGLAICVLGLVQALLDRNLGKAAHRFCIILFSLLVAYVFSNLLGQLIDDYAGGFAAIVMRALIFLESIISASATLVLLAFLLDSCGDNWRHSVVFRVAAVLWLAYLAMLVCTELTGIFYYIDECNVYHRGPLYPVLLVPPVLIMAICLIVLVRRRGSLSSRERMAFGVYIILPAVAMVFQMLSYGLYVIVLGTSIAAFVMFAFIQRDQAERYYQAEVENARLKSDIMLSQLQPHFLCNTLGAIGRLCRNDPEAKEAIGVFSRYLRENVDSLSQEAPVPFERELEHARTYLELERLRFGDDLHTAFDIECADFLLPTLTLQPLVENAVRHGIRGTEDGTGTVTVSTHELEDHWEISVSDDGAGFEPDVLPDDGRPHVGLANVRERLWLVCGGELRIESELGRGSRVTIVIPKSEEGGR